MICGDFIGIIAGLGMLYLSPGSGMFCGWRDGCPPAPTASGGVGAAPPNPPREAGREEPEPSGRGEGGGLSSPFIRRATEAAVIRTARSGHCWRRFMQGSLNIIVCSTITARRKPPWFVSRGGRGGRGSDRLTIIRPRPDAPGWTRQAGGGQQGSIAIAGAGGSPITCCWTGRA